MYFDAVINNDDLTVRCNRVPTEVKKFLETLDPSAYDSIHVMQGSSLNRFEVKEYLKL